MTQRHPPPEKRRRVFTPAAHVDTDTEPASPHRAGHYVGLHPEDTPRTTEGDVRQHLVPDIYPNGKRVANSQMRYRPVDTLDDMIARGDAIKMDDGIMYRAQEERDTYYYAHEGSPPIPKRASRVSRRTTGEPRALPEPAESLRQRTKKRWRLHPLFWIGLGLLVITAGGVGLNALGVWFHDWRTTSTYGYPLTFQIDAVVGHNGDSPEHPSHFIIVNLHAHIIIVELPAGDMSKSLIYSGGLVTGDQPDLTPVTLSFQNEPGSRGPAMLIHISGSTMIWLNTGSKFVPPSGTSTGG